MASEGATSIPTPPETELPPPNIPAQAVSQGGHFEHARVGTAVFVLRARTPLTAGVDANANVDAAQTTTAESTEMKEDDQPTSVDSEAEVDFIIGQRLGSHGSGTWALPGGHLEFGESFEECAKREVLEETGLRITKPEFLTATNDVMADVGKHYVTIFMVARRIADDEDAGVEPALCEKDKCKEWRWIAWTDFVDWAQREIDGRSVDADGASKLFSPLLALVQQRPDLVPRLPAR